MQEKIKKVNLEYMGQEERKLALVRKSLDIIKDYLEEEVGEEPEHIEEGDLRSSLWQGYSVLNNYVKDESMV